MALGRGLGALVAQFRSDDRGERKLTTVAQGGLFDATLLFEAHETRGSGAVRWPGWGGLGVWGFRSRAGDEGISHEE